MKTARSNAAGANFCGPCSTRRLPRPTRAGARRSHPRAGSGRTVVVGAGKAAAAMARAFETRWPGPLEGLVVTRYGHAVPCDRIEIVEASHPVPDAAGERAARRILDLAHGLGPDDQLVCLASGGGSALLAAAGARPDPADKQAVTRALLRSGATIGEINTVRKHLSAIKGGRLAAAAAPARVVTLAISDVPGDDPAVIASGPTVPDPTTFADARAVLAKYRIAEPAAVVAHLAAAADETPKPGDPIFARTPVRADREPAGTRCAPPPRSRCGGTSRRSCSATASRAKRAMWRSCTPRSPASCAPASSASAPDGGAAGGAAVGRRDHGDRAGTGPRRAQRRVPAGAAVALDGAAGISALACDTDGIDGTEDNAGAIIYPDSIARAAACGIATKAALADNDGYGFFAALGDLVVTGPTLTNVNDFRAILVRA